jgi:hypothetical protein
VARVPVDALEAPHFLDGLLLPPAPPKALLKGRDLQKALLGGSRLTARSLERVLLLDRLKKELGRREE